MKRNLLQVLRSPQWRETVATVLALSLILQSAPAQAPQWWTNQGVFELGAVADDYAAANVGQLKNMAQKAAAEMNARTYLESGPDITSMIAGWNPPSGDDYAALTVGQLKAVATPLYDQISRTWWGDYFGNEPLYPWGELANEDDYAIANVGQLKNVFSFDLDSIDYDEDGLPDWWELQTTVFDPADGWDGYSDEDNDGLTAAQEFILGTAFNNDDTDGNGVKDRDEDPDGDGFTHAEELALGTNPLDANSRPPPEAKVRVRAWTMTQFDLWTRDASPYGTPLMIDYHRLTSANGAPPQDTATTFPVNVYPDPPTDFADYSAPTIESSGWMAESTDPPAADGTVSTLGGLPAYVDGHADPEWMTVYRFAPTVTSAGWSAVAKRLQLVSPKPLLDAVRRTWLVVQVSFDTQGNAVNVPVGSVTLDLPAGETAGPMAMTQEPPPTETNRGYTYRLLPIEIVQPAISSSGEVGALQVTMFPRISRWGSKRGARHQVDNDDRSTFPDSDPDRIVIRIPSLIAQDENKLRVKVSTTGGTAGYDDSGAELEFDKIGTAFESKPIVLVADADYDALAVGANTPPDGAKNDRSFLASPGGKLEIEVLDVGGTKFEVPIQRFTNRIKIQNVFLNLDAAEKAAAQRCIDEHEKRLTEIYAQIHVRAEIQPHFDLAIEDLKPIIGPRRNSDGQIDDPAYDSQHSTFRTIIWNADSKGAIQDAIKVVWISSDHSQSDGLYGLNLRQAALREDYVLLFLNELNDGETKAHRYSMVAAHEVGHTLLPGSGKHLKPAPSVGGMLDYESYYLMCVGFRSNAIKVGEPDASAKHWFLSGNNDGDPERIRNSPWCPRVSQ